MGLGSKIWLRLFLGVCFFGWIAAGGAAAAPDPVAAEDVRGPTAPVTAGPLVTDTTIPQAPGTLNIEAAGFLPLTGGRFGSNWNRMGAGGNFAALSTPVTLKYGLMPRSEVNAVFQYMHNWAQSVDNPGPGGERSADFGGLGDTSLTYKYLLSEEKPAFPAMAGILTVNFPSGHHRRLNPGLLGTDQLGQGAYTFTPGLNFFKYWPPALLYANVWYTLAADATVGGQRRYYQDQVTVNLAAEYPLNRRWIFLLEYLSFYDGARLIGHRPNQPSTALMSVLPGLELIVNPNLYFEAGVQIDLWGKNHNYNYTPILAAYLNLDFNPK